MSNVVDITARLPQPPSPLDFDLDACLVGAVDEVEQIVQAMARTIAIALVRRPSAVLDIRAFDCAEGPVFSVTVRED